MTMNTKRLNISIDDVSPHPNASDKVLDRCFELIKVFPKIKFTLFVPCAYWRTLGSPTPVKYKWSKEGALINQKTKEPLFLDRFPDFCDRIRNLNPEHFEIGFHGYLHGIPHVSNNDEVAAVNYEQARDVFLKMFKMINSTALKNVFKPIFRPPGWRMSPDAIKAASDIGMEIFALGSFDYAINSYQNQDKKVQTVYETCSPPISHLKLTNRTEIVYHSCEWLDNYLSPKYTNELSTFIKKNREQIKFCFMEDML